MADPQAPAQYHNPVVDPNCVPPPYPARTDHIPTSMDGIDAAWLSRMMGYKYSGVVASNMETVELLNRHTTKWRIMVAWNEAGVAAGLPALQQPDHASAADAGLDFHAERGQVVGHRRRGAHLLGGQLRVLMDGATQGHHLGLHGGGAFIQVLQFNFDICIFGECVVTLLNFTYIGVDVHLLSSFFELRSGLCCF